MDTRILPAANNLLACLVTELALNPDPPANSCLRAGDEVLHDVDAQTGVDTVCCPGLAYVRIGDVYPSSNFPTPDTEIVGKCFPLGWAVTLVMGVVRCIPNFGSTSGPDCIDWGTAAAHDANDVDAMMKALCCWERTLDRGRLWLAQGSTVSMQADCIERSMPVLLGIGKCC